MGAWRSYCSRVELLQERGVTTCTGGKNNIPCKRKELLHVVGSHCSTEELLQERSVTAGGRINSLKELQHVERGSLCRTEGYCRRQEFTRMERSFYMKGRVNTASGRSYYRRKD
jgi:hypothetical protein